MHKIHKWKLEKRTSRVYFLTLLHPLPLNSIKIEHQLHNKLKLPFETNVTSHFVIRDQAHHNWVRGNQEVMKFFMNLSKNFIITKVKLLAGSYLSKRLGQGEGEDSGEKWFNLVSTGSENTSIYSICLSWSFSWCHVLRQRLCTSLQWGLSP